MKQPLMIAGKRDLGMQKALRLIALPAALLAWSSPLAACSGIAARIELKGGGSRLLQDVCIFNKGDAPKPTVPTTLPTQIRPVPAAPVIAAPPTIDLSLADGSEIDVRFDSIKQIRLDGVTQVPDGTSSTHLLANIHIAFKRSEKEFDGQTSLARMISPKYETDRALLRNIEDPFVVRGKDPEIDGAEVKLRLSQVKSILFPDANDSNK